MESITNIINNNTPSNNENEINKCPHCGKPYKFKMFDLTFGGRAIKIAVPDCDCETILQKKAEEAKEKARIERAKKFEKEQLAKRFTNSMMSPLFRDKTFDNLEINTDMTRCREYSQNFVPNDSEGIQMIGKPGTGKTTLLAAISNELIQKGHNVLFTTFSTLLDKFSSHSYSNAGDISSLLEWLTRYDFVVLDDIGRENYTETRKVLAFRIIDQLLNYKVVTAFTANPESIAKLKDIPEWDAAIDRLKEMCPMQFTFQGESYRGKKKKI